MRPSTECPGRISISFSRKALQQSRPRPTLTHTFSKRRADSVVPTRELRTVLDGIRLIETSPFDTAAARTCSYCIHILVKGALWPLPS